jgi:hypothetical protein
VILGPKAVRKNIHDQFQLTASRYKYC